MLRKAKLTTRNGSHWLKMNQTRDKVYILRERMNRLDDQESIVLVKDRFFVLSKAKLM